MRKNEKNNEIKPHSDITKNSIETSETEPHIDIEISVKSVHGEPQNAFELINKYGTYNIQPTSDTHHDFPKIAQGLSEKENEKSKKTEFGEKYLK